MGLTFLLCTNVVVLLFAVHGNDKKVVHNDNGDQD